MRQVLAMCVRKGEKLLLYVYLNRLFNKTPQQLNENIAFFSNVDKNKSINYR